MATIAKENCFHRLLAPAPTDGSAMIAIAICGRMSEGFVSNFHCIENASDSNIYYLTEHFSIVLFDLFADYSLATLRIAVTFLTVIMLINEQFSLREKKINERRWKHNERSFGTKK